MRAALSALCAALLAVSAAAGEGETEFAPQRVTVRPEGVKHIYLAQLLEPIDRPIVEEIKLPGLTVLTKIDERGKLKLDTAGKGRFGQTVSGSAKGVQLTLKREAPPGGSRAARQPKLRMVLYLTKTGDGKWRYRNATQLTLMVGREKLAVVDANANGVYNEPGVDGITWEGYAYVFPLPAPEERWCTRAMELTGLKMGPWGEDAEVSGRKLKTTVGAAQGVLEGVNEERVKIGLTPRPENVKLSADLQKHCAYMAKNGKLQHHEDKGKPGYTPEGHKAGMRSILAMGRGAPGVALGMVNTYFHRQDVIRPQAVGFGVGYEGRYSGIDGRSDLDTSIQVRWPILCPVPRQTGVHTRYSKEAPDATPGDSAAGYPITVYFGTNKLSLKSYSLRMLPPGFDDIPRIESLVESGKDLPGESLDCYEFDPKKGASAGMTKYQACVCIMAKDPLEKGRTFEVTLEVEVRVEPWKRTWYFSTGRGKRGGFGS
ncbi:MAG: CAP domain-containing protein [Planctomycetota bacterium]|jgi:hypothetical protein